MKEWSATVDGHIARWSSRLSRTGREWWPRYAYHFTDVRNAQSILNSGLLLSRAEAMARGVMVTDNADPEVIAQTDPDHLNNVRLYFRPKTPTQYRNEGIRHSARQMRGHCPCPVYFLFRLRDVLCQDECRFSSGTLASFRYGHSDREHDFIGMPWDDIYSDGAMPPEPRKSGVKRARHAELIIPQEMDIKPCLGGVYARSPGELATLMFGLTEQARTTWGRHIRIGYDQLFYRVYPYVKTVAGAAGTRITVEFQKPAAYSQQLRFSFKPIGSNTVWSHEGALDAGRSTITYTLGTHYKEGVLTLHLEGCQVYHGPVILDELPF